MKILTFILSVSLVLATLPSFGFGMRENGPGTTDNLSFDAFHQKTKTDTVQKFVYTCPMHPEVVQDKAGKCAKCGMNLVKKESLKVTYSCPMHPEVKQDKPGKCPKCGMNLVKK